MEALVIRTATTAAASDDNDSERFAFIFWPHYELAVGCIDRINGRRLSPESVRITGEIKTDAKKNPSQKNQHGLYPSLPVRGADISALLGHRAENR
jgi:hypothetical protein